tara:strand:- start:311 stop:1477 length:1167 start_codon:yes stop_codon:yes gene_type:complete
MNRIDNSGTGIAGLGRNEDSMLAHVAPGEMVVPPVISPATQRIIQQEMMSAGLDPNEYTVGDGMSINPITGMAEFGFLKKLGKSLKKVVKKVAPVLSVAMPFIPGLNALSPFLQGALSAGVSKAAGLSTKDALLAGLTTGMGAKLKGPPGSITDAASKADNRKFFGEGGKFRDFFVKGSDESNLADKIVGAFGGGKDGQFMDGKNPIEFLSAKLLPQQFENALGTGPGGDGLLSSVTGSGGGLNPAMLAMAALYGKAVKEDYKKKEGGMRDIRQSIRPDLMPAQTFQGFDLGVRKNAAMGGLQELDMRMGGPSVGPGTGTSDDIAAMLSDGEFVMTSAANNGLGGFKVTKTETGLEMTPNGKPNRKKGAQNMDQLMKVFENYNNVGVA